MSNMTAVLLSCAMAVNADCYDHCYQRARNDNYSTYCWLDNDINGYYLPSQRQGVAQCSEELAYRYEVCERVCLE